jgi:hypothetical protein
MSLSSTPFAGPFTTQLVKETVTGAVPDNNVRTGATTLYMVRVDNSGNPSLPVYLHLYNNVAPTVGTTPPDITLLFAGGEASDTVWISGKLFATALSFACTTAGGLGGTTPPANPVITSIACS